MKNKKITRDQDKRAAKRKGRKNTNVSTREAVRQRAGNNGPQQGSH